MRSKIACEARQLIIHKNVLVDGAIVNIPSFVVTKELEDKITLKVKKVKKEAPAEEVASEETVEVKEETVEDGKE